MANESIGLAELIDKVKAELLTSPKNTRFLFVDNVELELQVVVTKDAKTGLKIDVLGIGGANVGADVEQRNIQRVKVSLSPVFTKEEMKEYCQKEAPEFYKSIFQGSVDATIKGTEERLG
ncbi:MAG: trypco2 family protein [Microcoleaceae cyanobacterium]